MKKRTTPESREFWQGVERVARFIDRSEKLKRAADRYVSAAGATIGATMPELALMVAIREEREGMWRDGYPALIRTESWYAAAGIIREHIAALRLLRAARGGG